MNKYSQNYDQILSTMRSKNENNSVRKIAGWITPHTRVLEFGCSSGYMTRYLKEELSCEVHVLEIDAEAVENARPYSVDCFVGDIESYGWVEYWKDKKFDVITFADVLEHLRNPESVLRQCKGLLRTGGEILISIPNISHNGVIADLLNNRFTYSTHGLLDTTHIRFFTKSSFEDLLENLGFEIVEYYGTKVKAKSSEFSLSYKNLPWYLRMILKYRSSGNVYQNLFRIREAHKIEA